MTTPTPAPREARETRTEATEFDAAQPMAVASFCTRCGEMVGMSMILRRGSVNAAFQKAELASGRRVEIVTVERTRREIVAECACERAAALSARETGQQT